MSAQEKEYVEANSTLQYANMREIFIKEFSILRLLSPSSLSSLIIPHLSSSLRFTVFFFLFLIAVDHQRSDILSSSFEFNEYLTLCLSKQLEDIVEIHPITWVIVDVSK